LEADVNLLLDTHILLWAAAEPERLSANAVSLINDENNRLYFSAASIGKL
jgi:PIN domain nuclease of toxin-antitoxin system